MDMKDETDQQTVTLASQCYARLHEGIISGAFPPGEKLRMVTLKAELNIGPTPIREALSRLATTGLIQAIDNKGFRVKPISEEEARDLYSTFAEIEQIALRSAIEHGTAKWEGEVMAALHRLSLIEKRRSPDFLAWLKENEAFHDTLVSVCGSPTLLQVRSSVYQQLSRYIHLSFHSGSSNLKQNFSDHEEIAKAVISRKGDRACALMKKHLVNSLKLVLHQLKELNYI
jgi:GntR family carbon starvation induced transcriptional regulator